MQFISGCIRLKTLRLEQKLFSHSDYTRYDLMNSILIFISVKYKNTHIYV